MGLFIPAAVFRECPTNIMDFRDLDPSFNYRPHNMPKETKSRDRRVQRGSQIS